MSYFRDAWNSLGKKSKENAMTEYVTQLSNIDPSWEEKVSEDISSVSLKHNIFR